MADLKSISLPHGTIPTQMFGNVNLQNAMTYVNENFAAVKDGVNEIVSSANSAISEKSDVGHNHNDDYAPLSHQHSQSDVIGIQSALDGKAELNHEHSQYLSSLPAHYHSTTEVQGLYESLKQKADAIHKHSMLDVEGLSTELEMKASTTYVDQQTTELGQSIKTIADVEILNYKANKGSSSVEGDTPRDVVSAPQNETVAQKNARVGSAERWARADHQHVFSAGSESGQYQSGANIGSDSASDAGYLNPDGINATTLRLTQSKWTRGSVDSSGNRIGTNITVCTGIKKYPNMSFFYAHFANLLFDSNGMLYEVETVKNFYMV